jgi:hypothetical protein
VRLIHIRLRSPSFQEEGGYEEAAYHHEATPSDQAAHAESAVLEEEGASFGPGLAVQGGRQATLRLDLSHMCIVEHNDSACTRYVDFFGNLVHGAENLAKGPSGRL